MDEINTTGSKGKFARQKLRAELQDVIGQEIISRNRD